MFLGNLKIFCLIVSLKLIFYIANPTSIRNHKIIEYKYKIFNQRRWNNEFFLGISTCVKLNL